MNSRTVVLDGEYIDGNSTDPDLDAEFSAFRDSLSEGESSEGSLSAYKIPLDDKGNPLAKTAKQAWLFTSPIGTVSLTDIIARIKREFMREGELTAVVRLTGHRPGKRGNEFNKIVRIEKENEPARPATPPGQTDIAQLMRAMQEMMSVSQARNDKLFQDMMQMQLRLAEVRQSQTPVNTAASDPLAFMEKMMLMQATMQRFAGIINAPAPSAAAALDPSQQLLNTIKVMKEVQSVMGAGGGNEEEPGILGAISKLAAPAFALMAENEKTKRAIIARGGPKRIAPAPRAAPATIPGAEPAAPAAATAAADPETEEETDMNLLALRETLQSLCLMAKEGTSGKDAADLMLSQIPEEYDQQVSELVDDSNKEKFFKSICTICKNCEQFPEFFEELRVNLNAAFEDPDQLNS